MKIKPCEKDVHKEQSVSIELRKLAIVRSGCRQNARLLARGGLSVRGGPPVHAPG